MSVSPVVVTLLLENEAIDTIMYSLMAGCEDVRQLCWPVVRECEELKHSTQISAAVTRDGRPLTRYAANTRSNGNAERESMDNSVKESLKNSAQENEALFYYLFYAGVLA